MAIIKKNTNNKCWQECGERETFLHCWCRGMYRQIDAVTVKNLPTRQETWVQSLRGEDPWKREWLPTPVFLPGEFHGQRSLVRCSRWGRQRVRYDWVTNTHFFTVKQYGSFSNSKSRIIWPSWVIYQGVIYLPGVMYYNSTPGYISEKNMNLKRLMHQNAQAVVFEISKIWEQPNSINRWMHKDVLCMSVCVCIYIYIYIWNTIKP